MHFPRSPLFTVTLLALSLLGLGACVGDPTPPDWDVASQQSNLSAAERVARAAMIRDAAAARGLYNGVLLAGIADAETQMSHCWSELTWACKGPNSVSCGGGPVVAGAGDGPCAIQQGGLGMFQFDAGTYAQTLVRDGERVLTIEGNVDAAVDFVIAMVKRSKHIAEPINTDDEALAWINEVRPWNDLYPVWIKTVTHYYNGCTPTSSCYPERYQRYRNHGLDIYEEMGADFWYGPTTGCGPVAAAGATIEENDFCFGAAGPVNFWRTEAAGSDGSLLWTHATDKPEASNWAVWNLNFVDPGEYLVEAYTAAPQAGSTLAIYEITASGNVESVVLDQSKVDGFQPIGTFSFAQGEGQRVRILDNTGEPSAAEKRLVVDAVRLTRIGDGGSGAMADPPGANTENSDGPGASPTEGPVRPAGLASGCSVTDGSRPSFPGTPLVLVGLALTILARRRGYRQA
ncbi:MAG: hypothetical protein KC416_09215 [Myxococcales bacterium]|nr:hypothetical protein [Myxococcales bacterium]